MSIFHRLSGFLKSSSPLITASCQAGGLMCIGDLISQKFIEKKEKIDIARNIRFGLLGFVFVGPILRTWYGVLETHIRFKSAGMTAGAKMVADQGLFAPIFLANFIGVNSLMQGNSWSHMKRDLSATYVDILISNYQLWPAVQTVNFWLVPLQYRVLFAQSVAVAWNTYLSWKTNSILSPPVQ